ncbi:MAG: tagaturonate epimerase family protein [Candidatus Bathyarchaeia archaeon]
MGNFAIIDLFKKLYRSKEQLRIYKKSIVKKNRCIYFLIREGIDRKLVVIYPLDKQDSLREFIFEKQDFFTIKNKKFGYIVCKCNSENASTLRRIFPFTRPRTIGLTPAIGLGDRLGLATPGHIRAIRGLKILPVLAQQSIREIERTKRMPQEVLDDVSWAVFQEGYRRDFAADADHLKSEEDINRTFQAGFTMYTIDPSDYIDAEADNYAPNVLIEKFDSLPWDELKIRKKRFLQRYLNKELILRLPNGEIIELRFSEESLMRNTVKFSSAILFVYRAYRQLRELFGRKRFDFEVSIDETEKHTTALEHFFIVLELKRLGVRFNSLALKFVGRFEKGRDYIGNLKEFEEDFIKHVLISKSLGPYKLSIHSGSDKFSIYPIIGRIAPNIIHLKTSGTSYLESLRVIARRDPNLFKEIVKYSLDSFEVDRKSYNVSADLRLAPIPELVPNEEMEKIFLDENIGRQILHVTFGSVLTAKDENGNWLFRERIKRVLLENEEEFYEIIAAHIKKHVEMCFPT